MLIDFLYNRGSGRKEIQEKVCSSLTEQAVVFAALGHES